MTEPSSEPRTALVTGAGTGIGRHAAVALANAGYQVVLAGRRSELLEETASACGASSLTVTADVGKPEDVAELFAQTQSTFGKLRHKDTP